MNKQDKKEIMNLIKYKKMLGGRKMELSEAIEILKAYKERKTDLMDIRVIFEAIDVVLDKLEITIAMKEVAFEDGYRKGKAKGIDEGFHSGFGMGLKRGTEITKEVE